MCMGFLQTMVISDPLVSTETKVYKKGRDPCWLGASVVNCMWELRELRWVRNCWVCSALWVTKVSSTYLSQTWGVVGGA